MLFNFKENTHFIDKNGAVLAINFHNYPFRPWADFEASALMSCFIVNNYSQ
jgi:hypothetical protein